METISELCYRFPIVTVGEVQLSHPHQIPMEHEINA